MKIKGLYTRSGTYQVSTDNPNVYCNANCGPYHLNPQEEKVVKFIIDCQAEGFLSVQIYVDYCMGTEQAATDTILLHVVQSDDYYEYPWDPATFIFKDNSTLRLWTCANSEERVWDKRIQPEEKQQVIFSAAPIVATTHQGDTIVGRQDYSAVLTGPRDVIHHVWAEDPDQPECDLHVVWSKNTFICSWPLEIPNHHRWWWIDIHKQIFMWDGATCSEWKKEQIIKQIWITKGQPPLWWPAVGVGAQEYEDIYFGYFADVDAPYDAGCNGCNTAGYDYFREIAWLHGYDAGQHPEYEEYYVGLALTDRDGNKVLPWGMHCVRNDSFLFAQDGWHWLDGQLYSLAATPDIHIQDEGIDTLDRTVVMTADKIEGGTADFSSEFILIEAFIETGLADLQEHIDSTRGILVPHLDSLGLLDQCPICGDANEDGIIDAADIVFKINYLFVEGSPAPSWPISRADDNGDGIIDAADIVHEINYLYVPDSPAPNCPGFEP